MESHLSKTLLKIKVICTYCVVASIFLDNTKTFMFCWLRLGSFMTQSLSLTIEAKTKHTQNTCITFRVYSPGIYGSGGLGYHYFGYGFKHGWKIYFENFL